MSQKGEKGKRSKRNESVLRPPTQNASTPSPQKFHICGLTVRGKTQECERYTREATLGDKCPLRLHVPNGRLATFWIQPYPIQSFILSLGQHHSSRHLSSLLMLHSHATFLSCSLPGLPSSLIRCARSHFLFIVLKYRPFALGICDSPQPSSYWA